MYCVLVLLRTIDVVVMLGVCHTPVLKNKTEVSIRVPRMFKSHV
jgi:hypothetical protein